MAAFDSAGVIGCAPGNPAVCMPRWTDRTGAIIFGGPAVGPDGTAYVTGTSLTSFSADGTTGCGGSPVVCTPLHTASLGNGSLALPPAVVGDAVVVSVFSGGAALEAFHTGTLAALGTFTVSSGLPTGIVVDSGTVFVSTSGGLLHAWKP